MPEEFCRRIGYGDGVSTSEAERLSSPAVCTPSATAASSVGLLTSAAVLRLRAVPGRNTAYFKRTGRSISTETKESITWRIEPWIRRELRALLNDPDPTLLVAVAPELFVRAIDRSNFELFVRAIDRSNFSSSAQITDFQDHDLRRFLDSRTDMFWHELRCYAESHFNMDAYDQRVEYEPLD